MTRLRPIEPRQVYEFHDHEILVLGEGRHEHDLMYDTIVNSRPRKTLGRGVLLDRWVNIVEDIPAGVAFVDVSVCNYLAQAILRCKKLTFFKMAHDGSVNFLGTGSDVFHEEELTG